MSSELTAADALRLVADNVEAGRPPTHFIRRFDGDPCEQVMVSPAWSLSWLIRAAGGGRVLRVKEYRTVNVRLPEPIQGRPEVGRYVWVVDPSHATPVFQVRWSADNSPLRNQWRRGMLYATKEDALEVFKALFGEEE